MKKIFLFIVPLASLALLYLFNQAFTSYQFSCDIAHSYQRQLKHLDFLTQNYLMGRIETLHMISPLSSKEIRTESAEKRDSFELAMNRALDSLKSNIHSEDERKIFDNMVEKLEAIEVIMKEAGLTNARSHLEKMTQLRGPYRRAAQAYAEYLEGARKKEDSDAKESLSKMQRWFKALVYVQLLGIGMIIYNVRTVRSKI